MDHNEFFEKLKLNYVARCYLFTGEENYTKESALRSLRAKLLPEGLEALNEMVMEGQDADDIIAACETLPMMAERRLVIVRDFAPLTSGASKGEKDETARMLDYMPKLPDTTCLVFYMRAKADERKALFKGLNGQQGVQIVRFDRLSDADLNKWVTREVRRGGKSISYDLIDSLIFRGGRGLTRLSGELDKVIAHAGDRETILEEDLEVVTPTLECTIFQLIDALIARNAVQAYRMLDRILDSGEDRVRILAMITRQMRFMAQITLMQKRRASDEEIMRELDITKYGLKNTRAQLRVLPESKVIATYKQCVNMEYSIKSGAMSDEEALGKLMLGWLTGM